MGIPKLKKKVELNYRRGGTSRYCGHCNHFVSELSRCRLIGLDGGRMYQVSPQGLCDRWDNSNHMKQYRDIF